MEQLFEAISRLSTPTPRLRYGRRSLSN